jgi:hypothetical protein
MFTTFLAVCVMSLALPARGAQAAVIDFDAVVRDPVTLTNIQAAYYSGVNASDGLHLNPAGY